MLNKLNVKAMLYLCIPLVISVLAVIFSLISLGMAAVILGVVALAAGIAEMVLCEKLHLNKKTVSILFVIALALCVFVVVLVGGTALADYFTNNF